LRRGWLREKSSRRTWVQEARDAC